MAEDPFKKLEEQLHCSVCNDIYTDPKLLQCFHVFCQKCLLPLGVRDQQHGQLSLTCPICRHVTPIPARGVAGLQSAFLMNRLLEIYESVKNSASLSLQAHRASDWNPTMKTRACFDHADRALELYCETCKELICLRCILRGGEHHTHDYMELKEAFERYQAEMIPSLEPLKRQVAIVKKALEEAERNHKDICYQRATVERKIRSGFQHLRETLNDRETRLIRELEQINSNKLKCLEAQRSKMEFTLAKLDSCLHFVEDSLKLGNESDVLMMKVNTVQQVEELSMPFKPHSMKPTVKADVTFFISEDLTALCENHGQIITPGLLDLSNCHITGKVAEMAQVGEHATAVFQAFDFIGKPYEQLIASESLDCELVSEIVGTIAASCSVERRGQGQYEISYQPTVKGRHQLHIKVEGQHIRESPFNLIVKSSTEKLGIPISSIDEVAGPKKVVITQKGELLVTEGERHCVSVFSPNGEKLRSFGERGSGGSSKGHLQDPGGVAVDDEGNILVADSRRYCIQKFTTEGRHLTTKVFYSNEFLQFSCPVDVAFNARNGKIYVVDQINHRIQILNSDLTFSGTIGKKRGNGKGQFCSPCGIACDSTGNVYVADSQNHRIQVFDSEGGGKHLRMFGRRGLGRGELDSPTGVVVDVSGMVYVSEAGNHRVSVFTSEGQFVTTFGHKGEGPGEFNYPRGLAVDSSGVVYVCDYQNNSVKIF